MSLFLVTSLHPQKYLVLYSVISISIVGLSIKSIVINWCQRENSLYYTLRNMISVYIVNPTEYQLNLVNDELLQSFNRQYRNLYLI
jgi:hypothetical protein